jgi:hypothetical protein
VGTDVNVLFSMPTKKVFGKDLVTAQVTFDGEQVCGYPNLDPQVIRNYMKCLPENEYVVIKLGEKL